MASKHYEKQKKHSRARLSIDLVHSKSLAGGQFTLFDFVDACFSFSSLKKEAAIKVLESLKQEPKTFKQLQGETSLHKSTLYLLLSALEKSGLVEGSPGRGKPYRLSPRFSEHVQAYASWWSNWLEH